MISKEQLYSDVTLPRLLTAQEVANILNISRSFAYTLLQTGQIPSIRLGRSVRVRPQDLEEYIDSNTSVGIRSI
jgi:excisionase family DNA binding protein